MNEYINNVVIFWTAFFAFLLAIIFHLYTKIGEHHASKHTRPHPDRIDKAIKELRRRRIKKITNDRWQEITGVSDATATRDLKKLFELGILKKYGHKKGVYYSFR